MRQQRTEAVAGSSSERYARTVIVPHIFESSSAVATSFGADATRIAQFATSVLLLLPQACFEAG